jgi:hypothetical protein
MGVFISEQQKANLVLNSQTPFQDHLPILKLELIGTNYTWLISRFEPNTTDVVFGLIQMNDIIKLTAMELSTINKLRGPDCSLLYEGILFTKEELTSPIVVQDISFKAKYPLSVYQEVALQLGELSTNDEKNLSIWESFEHLKVDNL